MPLRRRAVCPSAAVVGDASFPARVPWAGMEIVTPHDAQARYRRKLTAAGQAGWIGYRDQQTETCDEVGADVIVHVVTQPAMEADQCRRPPRDLSPVSPLGLS